MMLQNIRGTQDEEKEEIMIRDVAGIAFAGMSILVKKKIKY